MNIINQIQRNCQINQVIVEYCSLSYFSTLKIKPIHFRIINRDGITWGVADSISIEEEDEHYQIFFELDGMILESVNTSSINHLEIESLSQDDFKRMKREYHNLFK